MDGACSTLRLKDDKLELCCKYVKGETYYKKAYVNTRRYKLCFGDCSTNKVNGSCWRCMGCVNKPSTTILPTRTTIPPFSKEIAELKARGVAFMIATYVLGGFIALLVLFLLIYCLKRQCKGLQKDTEKQQLLANGKETPSSLESLVTIDPKKDDIDRNDEYDEAARYNTIERASDSDRLSEKCTSIVSVNLPAENIVTNQGDTEHLPPTDNFNNVA